MKNNKKGTIVAGIAFAVFVAAFFCPKASKAFEDNTAPEITFLNFSPTEIDTSQEDQSVTITIGVKDTGVGICPTGFNNNCVYDATNGSYLNVGLSPLIGTQNRQAYNTDFTRTSGDDAEGTYTATLTIPYGSKVGIWQVSLVMLTDKLGNQAQWSPTASGFDWVQNTSNIPNVNTLTIANTADSNSVKIEKEWTLSSSKASVVFPENTIVTKSGGDSFRFYKMINEEASISDLTTDGLTGYTAGTIRFGIPGVNLNFDRNVTVALNVGSQYNGNTLTIKSLGEGANSWTSDTTCKVSNGTCQFSTNHATYFAARSSKNMEGKLKLKVSMKKRTRKSTIKLSGKTGKYLAVTISVNGQVQRTLTAKKKGKFSARIPLAIGANTVVVQAANSTGTKTVAKIVTRR